MHGSFRVEGSLELLHRYVHRFRGGLVVKSHRPCVSLNSRLESNKEEERSSLERCVTRATGICTAPHTLRTITI